MNCKELIDRLLEYVEGELVAEQRHLFDLHLRDCQKCVIYIESYSITMKFGRLLPKTGPLPLKLEARLLSLLRDHLGERKHEEEVV